MQQIPEIPAEVEEAIASGLQLAKQQSKQQLQITTLLISALYLWKWWTL